MKNLVNKSFFWLLAIFSAATITFSCQTGDKEKITYQYTYFKNGKIESTTPHVDGKPHGKKLEYYEDGALRMEVPYENGVVNGDVKVYYPDGKVYSITPRINGMIEGLVKKYHKNGKLLSETPYSKDVLLPGLKEFDEKGRLRDQYTVEFEEKTARRGEELEITLEMRVDSKIRSAKFFQYVELSDTSEAFIPIPTKENVGRLLVYLPPGASINKSVKVKAVFVTRFHNRGALFDEYTLKKRN